MPRRRVRQTQKVRRAYIGVHEPRIETIKQIRYANPECHALSAAERYRYFLFDTGIRHEVGGHLSLVVIADDVVEIAMKGKKESLNVAVATGIALFKLS